METLRNALGFFEEHGQIIVRRTKSGRQEPAMTLHPDWIPKRSANGSIEEYGNLWGLVEKISISRREGKNRYDHVNDAINLL